MAVVQIHIETANKRSKIGIGSATQTISKENLAKDPRNWKFSNGFPWKQKSLFFANNDPRKW